MLISNKKGLHQACLANQFRVPEYKCSLNSREYLLAVKAQTVYVLRCHEV